MFVVSEQQQICDVYPSVSAVSLSLIIKCLLVWMLCRPLVSFDQSFHSCSFLAGNKLNVCQTSVSSLCRLLNVPCRYITAQLFGKAHPLLCLMAAFTLFQKEFRLPQPQKSWVWFTSRSRQSLQHVRWVVSCLLLISGVMKIQKDPSFKGLDRLFCCCCCRFSFC